MNLLLSKSDFWKILEKMRNYLDIILSWLVLLSEYIYQALLSIRIGKREYCCENGHPVATTGQNCEAIVLKDAPCGHPAEVPCYLTEEAWKCREIVQKLKESCGHSIKMECWEDESGVKCDVFGRKPLPCGHLSKEKYLCWQQRTNEICLTRDELRLSCGHILLLSCGESLDNGTKIKCEKPMSKKFPNCEHEINLPCYEDIAELPCIACSDDTTYLRGIEGRSKQMKSSPKLCPHGKALPFKPSDVPCEYICKLRLTCGHSCSLRCHPQDPNRHMCNQKCSKRLSCDHKCIQEHPCQDPCPPCKTFVDHSFQACDHIVMWECSSAIPEYERVCRSECTNYLGCGHKCSQLCGAHFEKECPPCDEQLHNFPLPCQHSCQTPCKEHEVVNGKWKCPPCPYGGVTTCPEGHKIFIGCPADKSKQVLCETVVESELELACGRKEIYRFLCHQRQGIIEAARTGEMHAKLCSATCETQFDNDSCGHVCHGSCSKCFSSILHERCSEACENYLPCNHRCKSPCPVFCRPCENECENSCEHRKCQEACGFPCLACQEPCSYACEHEKCNRLCSQVCDRSPCKKPCRLKLECGHNCIGFCGEVCPELCMICDKVSLAIKGWTLTPENRFIMLPCRHTFPVETLDRVFKESADKNHPAVCPDRYCRRVIYNCKRYSAIVQKYTLKIIKNKNILYGTKKEISESQEMAWKLLGPFHRVDNMMFKAIEPFRRFIQEKLTSDSTIRITGEAETFYPMCLQNAESLVILSKLFRNISLKMCSLEDSNVPTDYVEKFRDQALTLVDALMQRSLPLYYQEIQDINMETGRLLDLYRLLLLKNPARPNQQLIESTFDTTLGLLLRPSRYFATVRRDYFDNMRAIAKLLSPFKQCLDFSDAGEEEK